METNEVMFIKEEELSDNCSLMSSGFVKEEVASIYDEEEGYILNCSFDNEEIKTEPSDFVVCMKSAETTFGVDVFPLDSVADSVNVQDECRPQGLHIKKTRKKRRKLKAEGQEKYSTWKTNERTTKTGRVRKDEIFKNQEYFCTLCRKSFLGRKCFRKHFTNHFTAVQNGFNCHICNYTTKKLEHINRHILETHFLEGNEAEKMFICFLCDKRFHEKRGLERHMFCHTGDGAFKCGECDYSCTRKYTLENHICMVHGYPRESKPRAKSENDESLYICHHCSCSFKGKHPLKMHIKRHTVFKNYKCSECDYVCSSSSDLQKHFAIHSEERPFVCNGCKKTYKRRSHLLIHFNGKYGCPGKKYVRRKRKQSKESKYIV